MKGGGDGCVRSWLCTAEALAPQQSVCGAWQPEADACSLVVLLDYHRALAVVSGHTLHLLDLRVRACTESLQTAL